MGNFDEGIRKMEAFTKEWPAYIARRNAVLAFLTGVAAGGFLVLLVE